jgi:hypothetical protein
MALNIQNGRLYSTDGKTWPAVSDVAHYVGQHHDRMNAEITAGTLPSSVAAVLSRAGWDGAALSGEDISTLSQYADSNGSSFSYNIHMAYSALGDAPTTEPAVPTTKAALKEATEFGRKNVRDDIGMRIQLWKQRPNGRTAEALLDEIDGYCSSGGVWPTRGSTGSGGTGGGGFHVPGSGS